MPFDEHMEEYSPLTTEEKLAAAQQEENPYLLSQWLLTLPKAAFSSPKAQEWLESCSMSLLLIVRRAAQQRINELLEEPAECASDARAAMQAAA